MNELDSYTRRVRELRKSKSKQWFTSSAERSVITLIEIVKGCENSICLSFSVEEFLDSMNYRSPLNNEDYINSIAHFVGRMVDTLLSETRSLEELESILSNGSPYVRILLRVCKSENIEVDVFKRKLFFLNLKNVVTSQVTRITQHLSKLGAEQHKIRDLEDSVSCKLCSIKYSKQKINMDLASDHLRAISFIIGDEEKLSAKYDHDYLRSLCCFNAKDDVSKLLNVFDRIWDSKDIGMVIL